MAESPLDEVRQAARSSGVRVRIHSGPMPQVPYRPDAQAKRYANSEQALLEAGGKRVNIRLQPKAAKALDRFMKRNNMNQTEAINYVLERISNVFRS